MEELVKIHEQIWKMLVEGAAKAKHEFHLPSVATAENNLPDTRTVVLRRVITQKRMLIHHTDLRSSKVEQLKINNNMCWLFYSKELKTQLRVYGTGKVHTNDELADEQWEASQVLSRRCYLTEPAPGSKSEELNTGIPDKYKSDLPTLEESESGRKNFAVVSCRVNKIDWLHLKATGHMRAEFLLDENNISCTWLIP